MIRATTALAAWAVVLYPASAQNPGRAEEVISQGAADALKTLQTGGDGDAFRIMGAVTVLSFLVACVFAWINHSRQTRYETTYRALDASHAQAIKDQHALHQVERVQWQNELAECREKHVNTLREVLAALHSSTAAITAASLSTAERTASAQELTKEITALITSQSANREHFRKLGEDIYGQGKANQENLTKIAWAIAGLGGGHSPALPPR